MSADVPPHGRVELDRARAAVVDGARAVVEVYRAPGPDADLLEVLDVLPRMVSAVTALERLERENRAHVERRRAEALAVPMHYVLEVGDRSAVCGLRDVYPHGWVGPVGAYLRRRVANGGTVCDGCSAGMPVAVWLDTEVTP
jgi:hypothetical protein